jgi:hypothetical protein
MTDITNKDRAGWAGIALLEYAIGKEGKGGLYETPETVLTDLLCDMRHYADMKGFDFGTCNARSSSLYGEEAAEEIGNQFGLRCPMCGRGDEIDIAATVWVRLCPDGTDVTAAANGDHEWCNQSSALCAACGHGGSVSDFSGSGERK